MVAHKWTEGQLKQHVKNAIYRVFDAAKTRDFGTLASMHYPKDEMFSKFDYSAPFKRQTYSQALMHEEVAYSNITDFNYKIDDLRIDLPSQEVAIATFHLETGGLFVNDYRFEGSPARASLRAYDGISLEGRSVAHSPRALFAVSPMSRQVRETKFGAEECKNLIKPILGFEISGLIFSNDLILLQELPLRQSKSICTACCARGTKS